MVKSELIRPSAGAELGIGTNRLFGVAWAGEEAVESRGSQHRRRQHLGTGGTAGAVAPYCWTLWEYLWEVVEPGDYTLLTRPCLSKRPRPTDTARPA